MYKTFHEKKIVRRIPIQQLIVCDLMSLNDLRSIDRKQNRSVATCTNNEMNDKILFLSVCHPNVIFFCIDMKTAKFAAAILADHRTTRRP